MRKRKESKPRSARNKRTLPVQAVYSQSRRDFSAADLQKFTVNEKGIPLEHVIAKMEAIQNGHAAKKA